MIAQTEPVILAYHSVHPRRRDPLSIIPGAFVWQMEFLATHDFTVVGLKERVEGMVDRRPLPSKSVILTFDDGYLDNYVYAYPILRRLGFPATVFVITRLVGTDEILEPHLSMCSYGGTREDYRILGWQEIQEMGGERVTFGSHSVTHPWLTDVAPEQVEWEVATSKAMLEKNLGRPVEFFCYPGGRFTPDIIESVKMAGYRGAVVTPSGPGVVDSQFTLKRVGIYRHDTMRSFRFKLTPAFRRLRENRLLWSAVRGWQRMRALRKDRIQMGC